MKSLKKERNFVYNEIYGLYDDNAESKIELFSGMNECTHLRK